MGRRRKWDGGNSVRHGSCCRDGRWRRVGEGAWLDSALTLAVGRSHAKRFQARSIQRRQVICVLLPVAMLGFFRPALLVPFELLKMSEQFSLGWVALLIRGSFGVALAVASAIGTK